MSQMCHKRTSAFRWVRFPEAPSTLLFATVVTTYCVVTT